MERGPAPLEILRAFLRERRTVKPKDFDLGRAVPKELLLTLLETATWAPTHGMTQPWHFFIYTSDSRQTLADHLQRIYHLITPVQNYRRDKWEKLAVSPLQSAAAIVIAKKRDPLGKIADIEEVEAVACAVQNFHLAASAAGLGVCWSSPPLCYSAEMKDWLGLSRDDDCLGLLYVGWPRAGYVWPDMPRREPVERKITWIAVE